jgi:hypothetical protein
MKILVVDAFLAPADSSHGRGKTGLSVFISMVKSSFKNAAASSGAELLSTYPPVIQIVGVQSLLDSNLICDGEWGLLDHYKENACKNFDSIDIIFIGGDSCTRPLDHRLSQLYVLCNMARKTNKPVFTSGGPALVEIVSLYGCGTIWNAINGDGGSDLASLPLSPYDSSPDNAVSVFYDAESGDLYTFNDSQRVWNPTYNLGLSRIARSGKMISPKFPLAELHLAVEDHLRDTSQEMLTVEFDHDKKIFIDKRFVQHWIFEGLNNAAHAFVITSLGEFRINRSKISEVVPQLSAFTVLATSRDSPILISIGHKFLFAAEINDGKSRIVMQQLINNFTRKMTTMILMDEEYNAFRRFRGSLHFCVFSESEPIHDYSRYAAISSISVKTRLPQEPAQYVVCESMTATRQSIFPSQDDVVHKTSTGIPKTQKIFKVPQEHSLQRLQDLVVRNGQTVQSCIEIIRAGSDDTEMYQSQVAMSPIRPRDSKPTATGRKVFTSNVGSTDFRKVLETNRGETSLAQVSVFRAGNSVFYQEELIDANVDIIGTAGYYLPHHSPRLTTKDAQYTATRVIPPRSKPLSTYKRIIARNSLVEGSGVYQGQYRDVYMTPREKEIALCKPSSSPKRNFITSFGTNAVIPLRKEGQIRPFSEYEKDSVSTIGVKAGDRVALRKDEKSKQIAGGWRNA